MNITFKDTLNQMSNEILKLFAADIKTSFDRGVGLIQSSLPGLISNIIMSSPEYGSLISGSLKYELGIPDAGAKVAMMINHWSSNIQYRISPPRAVRGKITGGFSAELFKADFSDILGTDYAQVYDSRGGYSLPWFQWLVLDGRTQVVPNHEISYRNTSRSRTGKAIMVPGAGWGLTSYSGTKENNWITRAIASGNKQIVSLLERAF